MICRELEPAGLASHIFSLGKPKIRISRTRS